MDQSHTVKIAAQASKIPRCNVPHEDFSYLSNFRTLDIGGLRPENQPTHRHRRKAFLSESHARVKTHYLRDRDAGHFGRWLGARSDVIYTIMSDEQQRQRPKGPRPLGLQPKSPPGIVEGLDRIPRYALRPSPAQRAILAATRLAEIMSFDPRSMRSCCF
jgi:hypothetical protein